MKSRIIFSIITVLITVSLKAQSYDTLWTKCYGGSNNDFGKSIVKTNDGEYAIIGKTESTDGDVFGNHGQYDIWLLKISNTGDTLWTKSFGGSDDEFGRSIWQTYDNGFIISGSAKSLDGDVTGLYGSQDFWILKLNSSGDTIWTRTYGGSGDEIATSILETTDTNYIAVGYTTSNDNDVHGQHGGQDYWVIKINSSGDTIWTRTLGGSAQDVATSVVETSDGGYLIGGSTESNNGDVTGLHGAKDFWIVKLSSTGAVLWSKTYGGTSDERIQSIKKLIDGGYILAGYTWSNDGDVHGHHGKGDYWIVKIDTNGSFIWQKCFGGTLEEAARFIKTSSYSGFLLAGFAMSENRDLDVNFGGKDIWIIKLNRYGNIIWKKSLGGSGWDEAWSIAKSNDGFFVIGNSDSNDGFIHGNHGNSDFWVVKLNDTINYPLIPATLPFTEKWENSSGTLNTSHTIYKNSSFFWMAETDTPVYGRVCWGKNAYKKNSGKGALTLDHNSVSGDTATNYAILTINLSDYQNTDLELAFSWADHNDEENPNDKVWIRGSAQDEWLEIYDLDPVSAPDNVFREVQDLDIDSVLAPASPPQSVSASFQVRFGQEDNYMTPWDGISFDDIRIYQLNPCTLPPVTLPFLDDFESYSGIRNTDTAYCFTDHEWCFDTDYQGEGRARWGTKAYLKNSGYGALTLDHLPSSGDLATNFAILTLNMSDYADSNLELAFAWTDSGNENHPNDKVWVRGSMEDDWVEIYDLDPESEPDGIYHEVQGLDIDKALASASPPQTVSSTFQIRFGQQDEYSTPWDGISYDDVRVSLAFPCNLSAITLPFTEDWESYKGIRHTDSTYCMSGYAWSFDTDHQGEGRTRWGTYAALDNSGTGALTMDHLPSSGDIAKNASVLTLNLSNYTSSENLELSFWWADHNDEDNPGDKVWIRGNLEDDWVEIFDLNPETTNDNEYQQVSGLDIDAVLGSASPAQTVSSTFQIRFGQEDNYSTFWDGISFDDIVVEENLFKSSEITEKDVKGNENISVYYSNGYIHIKSFGDAVFENKYALIYDIYGQMIANQNVPPGSVYKIKVNPCSCYMIIKIRSNSQVKVEKVLVW